MELSTKNQSPLYEDIHEYEAVPDTQAKTQQSLPPQPSGDYQFTTCPAYAPNTITAQSSGGAEGDGEYAIPRDEVTPRDEVSGVRRRNEGQHEEMTTGDGATGDEVSGAAKRDAEQYEDVTTGDAVTTGKGSGEEQYEAVGAV